MPVESYSWGWLEEEEDGFIAVQPQHLRGERAHQAEGISACMTTFFFLNQPAAVATSLLVSIKMGRA